MELTQKDTKMIKALSVLAMICLHLFDRLDYVGLYTPLVFLFGKPLCFYLGQLSDFCVMGFAFCSGYAHYKMFQNAELESYYKRRLKALLSLYVNYWIVLILFTFISMGVGNGARIPGDITTFIGNLTTVRLSYNGAWWYIFTFALIVVSSPISLTMVKKYQGLWVLGISGILYCIAFYFRFHVKSQQWLLYQFGLLGMTLFEYLIGAVCCRYQLFGKCKAFMKKQMSRGGATNDGASLLGWNFLISNIDCTQRCICTDFRNSHFVSVLGMGETGLDKECVSIHWGSLHQYLANTHVFQLGALQRFSLLCPIPRTDFGVNDGDNPRSVVCYRTHLQTT